MNCAAIMQKFDEYDCEVAISRRHESFYSSDKRWHAVVEKTDAGAEEKIAVSVVAASFDLGVARAYDRFLALAHEGMELTALPAPLEPINDEIPF